jgi:ABC-type dipeptide/oligopeptide/nickel transport system permease component
VNPQFIAIKLLRALITLWLIVTFAFVILRTSGDPIEALAGDGRTSSLHGGSWYFPDLRFF